ncbi:hypothetical protein LSH36_8g12094 [Paralvinella palmiformis]|uniref:non-specific serine/threonine protein kinase n=1 Tax=Paralvinella palmiformis TaxID=53620 RepID=A0AAD9KEF5_9ANNE|nr:hypothetical protein LSH36_8g12094 [Paralvinella palmiformis]
MAQSYPKIMGYRIKDELGNGSFGYCFVAQREADNEILALKQFRREHLDSDCVAKEMDLLMGLNHTNIVKYYGHAFDSNNMLCLLMEYCQGGDLNKYIERKFKDGSFITEEFIWKAFHQLVLALRECHSRNRFGRIILHRDLKPANVFFDKDMNVKLGDFGSSRMLPFNRDTTATFAGTLFYMSPEQMSYAPYDEKCDIWSLGCTVHEMCVRKPTFFGLTDVDVAAKIRNANYPTLPDKYSIDLRRAISSMLQLLPNDRCSIEQLAACPLMQRNISREKM